MDSISDSLAFWATILGTVLGIFGFIQSYTWLTTVASFLLLSAILALLYARRQRQRIRLAGVKVEGRSIDSLNLASLNRRLERNLVIQEIHQTATIDGENLTIASECAGYCQADQATVVEFSVDSDNNIPFGDLRCVAYDVQNDPERRHPIQPFLVGADGISKKIAVPLLAPLARQEPFRVFLRCELPGCMKAGVDYYTSVLSFAQDRVRQFTLRLVFVGQHPKWMRVYECGSSGTARLLKDLPPTHESRGGTEYLDHVENVPTRRARIYVFWRTDVGGKQGRSSASPVDSLEVAKS
jgi:hypothetical protein